MEKEFYCTNHIQTLGHSAFYVRYVQRIVWEAFLVDEVTTQILHSLISPGKGRSSAGAAAPWKR